MRITGSWLLAALLLVWPFSTQATGQERKLEEGRWAHRGVVLRVEGDFITFQDVCFGYGRFFGPVPLDVEGRFDVRGEFVVLPTTGSSTVPARYVGQVWKDHIAITVMSADFGGNEFVRAYVLRRGGRIGRIDDCGSK